MDAGASNSKDVKLLRNHLQELRSSIISVSFMCNASSSRMMGENILSTNSNLQSECLCVAKKPFSTKLVSTFIFAEV